MQIGQLAHLTGISAKMIRHYEGIGLVPTPARRQSGYRDYDHKDAHRLRFIRRARDLGFSLSQIHELLRLWDDRSRSNAQVKTLALRHVAELEDKARAMAEMAQALRHLAKTCQGDGRPDCPIMDGLAAAGPDAKSKQASI